MQISPLFHSRVKFLVVAFSLSLAWPADADTSRNEEIAERFAAADTNHDGQLTLAEAQAGMPRVAANFSKIDADGSGTVNEHRLYQLIRQSGDVGERTFEIEFLDPGVHAYAFTFG